MAERKEILLSVQNVSLFYGARPTLRDVNMEIKNIVREGHSQGQVVGLLGPSGIGKTWLLRILAGLISSSSGKVLVGKEQQPVAAGMVGVVPQNYLLFDHLTVLENLMIVQARHVQRIEKHERALAILERFKLYEHRKHYPAQLSGGQRQRIAIAQQMLCSEHFLLMDEPFSGLDLINKDIVCRLIGSVAGADDLNTIIVVTHDIEAALMIADTIWLFGFERDQVTGESLPGGHIVNTYDLISRGLAWQDNIKAKPEFSALQKEIEEQFMRLK